MPAKSGLIEDTNCRK